MAYIRFVIPGLPIVTSLLRRPQIVPQIGVRRVFHGRDAMSDAVENDPLISAFTGLPTRAAPKLEMTRWFPRVTTRGRRC